ncbi:MAG: CTP-dependent riboflavin kinase [Thaumarchaeota archaeon]|nr:CTP-dependent riboflavin kinase [Nitrososphaerota archaeon]
MKIKSSHIPTLIELLSQGAKERPISITTTDLAKKLGKSQQLASKHLDEMEKAGLIERIRSRGKTYVKLTKAGIEAGESLYSELAHAFGKGQEKVDITGTVFSGLGEGAYYISLKGYKKQFISRLGFDPFPGTLNLRLSSAVDRKIKSELNLAKGIHIDGFKDGKRTYGGAECFEASLNDQVEGAVLVIERTSHDDSVLEIISPVNVRQKFRLKDGDPVKVTVNMGASGIVP